MGRLRIVRGPPVEVADLAERTLFVAPPAGLRPVEAAHQDRGRPVPPRLLVAGPPAVVVRLEGAALGVEAAEQKGPAGHEAEQEHEEEDPGD